MTQNLKIELLEGGTLMYNGTEYAPLQVAEPQKTKNNVLYAVVKPEIGTIYHVIDSRNKALMSSWQNNTGDNERFSINNVFLTEENAQKQADRNKLLAEIQRFADENNEVMNWSTLEHQHYIIFDSHDEEWEFDTSCRYKLPGVIYFSSENLANQALEKFKDRLDILLD